MNPSRVISRLIDKFDGWITAPHPRAAGSLGLFRIIFSLFYLWHLSYVYLPDLARVPDQAWRPVLLVGIFGRPSAGLVSTLEPILVGLLVLLAAGLKTRWATMGVLLVGVYIDGFHQCLGKVEHSNGFLTFYIPLLMSFSRWGDVYSLDALRAQSRGAPGVRPDADDWRFAWPSRFALCVLSVLFFTSFWAKTVDGSWLTDAGVATNLLTTAEVTGSLFGPPTAPLNVWVAMLAPFQPILLAPVLLLEGLFFLALAGTRPRRAIVSMALVFHAFNAHFLAVTFTPVLIVYGLFVNWQGWLDRISPAIRRFRPGGSGPTGTAGPSSPGIVAGVVAGVVAVAVLTALAWMTDDGIRGVFNLFGLIDWRTVWLLVVPLLLIVPFLRAKNTFEAET